LRNGLKTDFSGDGIVSWLKGISYPIKRCWIAGSISTSIINLDYIAYFINNKSIFAEEIMLL
tara:strand:+ start:7709 stop:7894 length:186 start_codon:yes stop_codon:yes gene_type:complete